MDTSIHPLFSLVAAAVVSVTSVPGSQYTRNRTTSPPNSAPAGVSRVTTAPPLASRIGRCRINGSSPRAARTTVLPPREPNWRKLSGGKLGAYPVDDVRQPIATAEVRKQDGTTLSDVARFALHDLERGADRIGQIDLVDHQHVGVGDARATFARYLVAARHIDDIDLFFDKVRTECRGEIVAATFDKHQLQAWQIPLQRLDRREIHRDVVAYGRMRTTSRLHRDNPLGR